MVNSQQRTSIGNITSCCCLDKGSTSSNMSFEKDGYMPGEMVNMLIEIDNTNCTVDINSITISVTNNVTLRSRGHSTSDHYTVYSKRINGLSAGMSKTVIFNLCREPMQSVKRL